MRAEFWSGGLKGGDHSEDVGVNGRVILESIFGRVWTGVSWLRMQTCSRQL